MAWFNIIRATAAQFTAANEVLLDSRIGVETDTGKFKIGDGTTTWTSLAYSSPNGGTFTSLINAQAGLTATTAPITAAAGTASIASLNIPAGTVKTTPIAGDVFQDGAALYATANTTSGVGFLPITNYFYLATAGSAISTIANFFGASSGIPMVGATTAFYDIEFFLWFTNTADTNTATFTLSYGGAAPTIQNVFYEMSPAAGIVAPPGTATALTGQYLGDATQAKAFNTAALGSAATYYAHFKIWVQSKASLTGLNLQCTKNTGGTITPNIGSYWVARRLPAANTGLVV